jgi:hypothetical protein
VFTLNLAIRVGALIGAKVFFATTKYRGKVNEKRLIFSLTRVPKFSSND